jgi:hypothetical protein
MKTIRTISALLLMSFILLFSECSKDNDPTDSTNPQPSLPYYIKFKANGVVKLFEDGNPGYQSCGDCACASVPPLASINSNLSICQTSNNYITAVDIESWNGDNISLDESVFPNAGLYYVDNNESYGAEYVADQSGSEVKITSVVADGLFATKKMYKVSGTFNCKVALSEGSSVTTITEGQFVVRFSED